jgi:hypothetical protein
VVIFYLDSDLKAYKLKNLGNRTELELINLIPKEEKYLNLSDKFEFFWQSLWPQILENETEIFYFLGPNSSFSDSRVIFIWLKTYLIFKQNLNFFVDNIKNDLNLENLNSFLLQSLIFEAKQKNNQQLTYNKEPNIG